MAELGVETQRLVMPTRTNLDALEGVFVAGAALVDMKRQVDRVEQELRTLRTQREGYVAPVQSRGVCPTLIRWVQSADETRGVPSRWPRLLLWRPGGKSERFRRKHFCPRQIIYLSRFCTCTSIICTYYLLLSITGLQWISLVPIV